MYQIFEKSPLKNFDFSYSVIVHKKCTFCGQKRKKDFKMKNYNTVEEIHANNFCSERLYKRKTCPHLTYTDGVMDLMEVFNAHWIVDNVISYMQQVLKTLKRTEDTFYVVQIAIKQDNSGFMEVYHEGYVNNEYKDHISVIKQNIPYIDLPTKPDTKITRYKFYLELSNDEPVTFTLLLPSEH